MARPLEPYSEEKVQEYEEQLRDAYYYMEKQRVKEIKRLFILYITKRNIHLSFFKNHSIYKYFENDFQKTDKNYEFNYKKTEEIMEREKANILFEIEELKYKIFKLKKNKKKRKLVFEKEIKIISSDREYQKNIIEKAYDIISGAITDEKEKEIIDNHFKDWFKAELNIFLDIHHKKNKIFEWQEKRNKKRLDKTIERYEQLKNIINPLENIINVPIED
jgi:hypothetical protein